MRIQKTVCCFLASCLSLLIVFSGGFSSALAFSDGVYLSAASLHDLLGDTLQADIADTSFGNPDIHSVTLSYQGPVSVSGSTSSTISDGWPALLYSAYTPNLYNNPDYVTIDFSPFYSISDTFQLHSFVAVGGQRQIWTTAIPPYQSPQWRVHISGSQMTFEGTSSSTLDAVKLMDSGSVPHYFHAVNADISQNTAFSFSSVRVTFNDVKTDGGTLYVLVGCPYVSQDAVPSSGTIATTDPNQTTTTTTVTGSGVDLDETNSLLDRILQVLSDWLSAVGSVIASLFVPRESAVLQFKADLYDLFDSVFGDYSDLQDCLDDLHSALFSENAVSTITFPSIPIGEESTAPISVSLDPDIVVPFNGSSVRLLEVVKWAIDICALTAFINVIRRKIRAILVGESVVEVADSDN